MLPFPRLARPDDLRDVRLVAEAAYAAYVPTMGRRPAPMDADFATHQKQGELWILDLDGICAGYVVCLLMPDHLLLDNVAVAQSGRGHGAHLISWAEHLARQQAKPAVRLYTNAKMTQNLRLYPRLGYRQTHEATEHGFHRVYFEKVLSLSN